MTTKVSTTTNTTAPTELVARLAEIATIVETSQADIYSLKVSYKGSVTVHCVTAEGVDAVMSLLDDAPDLYPPTSSLYNRWGTFDEVVSVNVYGPPHAKVCYCGVPCDHKAGAR